MEQTADFLLGGGAPLHYGQFASGKRYRNPKRGVEAVICSTRVHPVSIGVLFVSAIGCVETASAQSWTVAKFFESQTDDPGLFEYQQGSGMSQRIGDTSRFLVGIDYATDGTLYGVTSRSGSSPLLRIDPTTGETTTIGQTGFDLFEGDIAFDPTTGVLYAGTEFDPQSLFSVDLTTGAATRIAQTVTEDLSALAIDATGNMWGVDTNIEFAGETAIADLVEIDKSNGDILSRRSLDIEFSDAVAGADFNAITNELYIASAAGDFYRVDTDTASATFLDNVGVQNNVSGLAFIPAPSAAALFGVAGIAATRRRS